MSGEAFVKTLRGNQTDVERIVWQQLRAHRLNNSKWKRQQPIGKYIVDFICFDARLIVELDGGQHSESASDTARDTWLVSQGFTVLRFWNNEVLQNLDGVLTRILEHLTVAQRSTLSPTPLPSRERGSVVSSPLPSRAKGSVVSPPLPSKDIGAVQVSLPSRDKGTLEAKQRGGREGAKKLPHPIRPKAQHEPTHH